MTGIAVIVPTIGRETLEPCLRSFLPDLLFDDQMIVMCDGKTPYEAVHQKVNALCDEYPEPDWVIAWEPYAGGWGHNLRNIAIDRYVDTSHVWTIDDDDIAAPDAINHLRNHTEDPWTVFKMRFMEGHFASGTVCWHYPQITYGNVGTPMMFAPVCDARFGLEYSGDYTYAQQLLEDLGDPVFAEETVALIRPLKES